MADIGDTDYIGDDIQKLIAPPSQEKKDRLRRPGWNRKKNKEYCEACRDGGELVCCERCPISYHPTCCDPPCDASDLPDKWICKQCRTVRESSVDDTEDKNPFIKLEGESVSVNPVQFSIPSNLSNCLSLPGMARPKPAQMIAMRGRAGIKSKRAYHEIDNNGMVQLPRTSSEPIRLCHYCDTSSRTSQLIACDFCPLYFHQDCLDPPLTNPPSSKWMCPTHPQRFFLQSRQLFQSQRKLVADLFSDEVDPNYIIINLLRRRQRSEKLTATAALLEKSSISFANFASMPRRKSSMVPLAVKKVYEDHKKKVKFGVDAADAKLWLESLETLRRNCGHDLNVPKEPPDEAPKNVEDRSKELLNQSKLFQAVFCPVGVDCQPILINENITKIGTSEMCNVRLGSGCSCVSSLHAVLFHDGLNRWELLNYSPFGLSVDGIQYGLETFDSPELGSDNPTDQSFTDRVHEIKGSIIFREDNTIAWKPTKKQTITDPDAEADESLPKVKLLKSNNVSKCGCSKAEPGWEAAAPINHGSIIIFGCYQYIFAVR